MSRFSYLKHTKFYQEGFKEGEELAEKKIKLKMAARLLNYEITVEDVAEIMELEIEQVRQIASQKQ
ncbi:hypothetical protein RIVM261_034850 [Rivularia sp. IAM M-261]|nr:hypothetical protein CAL7716_094780 [Calothrix sp. PCC 7716]GJD18529.1 hypothetical protein RIVM261_034850 [Rivularia sp. IAM M-261]